MLNLGITAHGGQCQEGRPACTPSHGSKPTGLEKKPRQPLAVSTVGGPTGGPWYMPQLAQLRLRLGEQSHEHFPGLLRCPRIIQQGLKALDVLLEDVGSPHDGNAL